MCNISSWALFLKDVFPALDSIYCFILVYLSGCVSDLRSCILIQIYNDRRLYFGGAGPGIVSNDISSSSPNADRRGGRGRGMQSLAY